jgi:hypothetical protein
MRIRLQGVQRLQWKGIGSGEAVTDCPDSNFRHCPKKYPLQMTLDRGENGNDNDGGSSTAVLSLG